MMKIMEKKIKIFQKKTDSRKTDTTFSKVKKNWKSRCIVFRVRTRNSLNQVCLDQRRLNNQLLKKMTQIFQDKQN